MMYVFFQGFIASVRHLLHVRSDASKLNTDVTQIDKVCFIRLDMSIRFPSYLKIQPWIYACNRYLENYISLK